MSIEGMLCAVGLALLAVGTLVRARTASPSRPVPIGTESGRTPQSIVTQRPSSPVGTAALWLGIASLVVAGGVVLLRLMLLPVVS